MVQRPLSVSPGPVGTLAGLGARVVERAWTAACVAAFLALCSLLRDFVTDDAWISVRYAENLAAGRGLVWNPDGPRVEGFSNPLLVAVEAVARLAGAAPLDTARTVGIAAGVGLLIVMAGWAPAVVGADAARVGVALTALCAPLALWAVGGLETVPAALALTAGVLLVARDEPGDALRGGAALAVLPWLRPEGLVVSLAVAFAAYARPGRLRRLAASAGPIVLSQFALEAVRLAEFGHLLPNSFIYKTGAGLTAKVLLKFLAQAAPVVVLAVLGARRAPARARLLAVPPAVYVGGALVTFDSANHFSRFFLPTWPQWALLAGVAVAAAARRVGARAGAALAGGLMVAMLLVTPGNAWSVRRWSERYASCLQGARLRAARWLSTRTPPHALFAISDAGLVPARAGGRAAIDDFLLNEAVIQRTGPLHVRQRVPMILGRRPDLVVLLSNSAVRFDGRYAIDRGLARAAWARGYRRAAVARGPGRGCRYHLFIQRRHE